MSTDLRTLDAELGQQSLSPVEAFFFLQMKKIILSHIKILRSDAT